MELGLHIANFTWNGGAPELSPTLGRLARSAEAAGITRLTVMDHLWQTPHVGDPRACDVHISNLRRKIERDPSDPQRIVTVREVGYKLMPV